MKKRQKKGDSSGNLGTPAEDKAVNKSTEYLSRCSDIDISDNERFLKIEESPIRRRHDESEEEQHPEMQQSGREISTDQYNFNQNSLSVKSIFTVDMLTPDDEIYTLQCPQSFKKQDLCNKNLDFSKHKASVTSKGEVFEVQLLSPEKKFVTLAVPKDPNSGSLFNFPLKGHVVIQKIVKFSTGEPMNEDDYEKNSVKFPDDIKVRHPLLGIDWKEHVDLANAAFNNSNKKKHKKRKREIMTLDDSMLDCKKIKQEFSDLEGGSPRKKKKRHDV